MLFKHPKVIQTLKGGSNTQKLFKHPNVVPAGANGRGGANGHALPSSLLLSSLELSDTTIYEP